MSRIIHFEKSSIKSEDYPVTTFPEIIFLGRSNVGKSSFINSILDRKQNSIAYTSGRPGKTQLLNFFRVDEKYMFVDVPGYGYAKVSQKQRQEFGKMIEGYLTERKQLELAVLLVDMRHTPSEDDCLMYDYLQYHHIPTIVVMTKSDKIGKTKRIEHRKKIIKKLSQNYELNEEYLFSYSITTKDDHLKIWQTFESVLYNDTL